MSTDLHHVHGRKLCVVFVKVTDESEGKVQLQCLHGRANAERGGLSLMTPEGARFGVPSTALPSLMPNDGTPMLKGAEYFVLVKTDREIDFLPPGGQFDG